MEQEQMSIMDAFIALEELEDEDFPVAEDKGNKKLTEGRTFNVRSPEDMDKAKAFVEHDEKKETPLEVIDVDADSIEHLKDNKEYIGQMLLTCDSCGATRFIDASELVETDLISEKSKKPIYNKDLECAHCHQVGNGFTLQGQVGAIEQPKSEIEPAVENDSLTSGENEEPMFDNDVDQAAEEAAPAEEEIPNEEEAKPEEAAFDNDIEEPAEQAESEEQGEESLTASGDEEEIDPDMQPIEHPEEDEEEKNEELEESIEFVPTKVSEFTHLILEPDSIENVSVFDLDAENPEQEIYQGPFNELPRSLLDANMVGFSTGEGKLVIRVSSPRKDSKTLEQVMDLFDDEFNDNIIVVDASTDEEIVSGTPLTVSNEAGERTFEVFETPKVLEIRVRSAQLPEEENVNYNEAFNGCSAEDRLIERVLKENHFKTYRAKDYGTNEYWLAESIRQREDLDILFENFIKGKDETLIKEFKAVTGYKEPLDILLEEKHNLGVQVSEDKCIKEAEDIMKADPTVIAVIYGYGGEGGFKSLPGGQMMEARTAKELEWATELVERDFVPAGSVRVLYRKSISEKVEFKTRKELSEAILKCQKTNQQYTVSRSTTEGYRYTLIKESPDFELMAPEEEAELVDEPAEETSEQTALMDPRDVELVDKLSRIAHDISTAIAESYGVEVNEAAILADLIQDLQLVSGQITPEQLENTPMNELTKAMYDAYNGFYEAMDELVSFVTGRPIRTTQAQKLRQAVDSLDSELFAPETIKERVKQPEFLLALQQGSVPGITYEGNPNDIRLLAAPGEDVGEALNEDLEDEGWRELKTFEEVREFSKGTKWSFGDPDEKEAKKYYDMYAAKYTLVGKGEGDNRVLAIKSPDGKIAMALDIKANPAKLNKPADEELEFDEKKFEDFINEWFDKNCEETKVFECVEGGIKEDGTIILEGKLNLEEGKEEDISFTLTPNKNLNEDLMDSKKVTTYTITSTSLPEGLFCKINESWLVPNNFQITFETEEEAQKFIDENIKTEEEECAYWDRLIAEIREEGNNIEGVEFQKKFSLERLPASRTIHKDPDGYAVSFEPIYLKDGIEVKDFEDKFPKHEWQMYGRLQDLK